MNDPSEVNNLIRSNKQMVLPPVTEFYQQVKWPRRKEASVHHIYLSSHSLTNQINDDDEKSRNRYHRPFQVRQRGRRLVRRESSRRRSLRQQTQRGFLLFPNLVISFTFF